MSSDTSLPDRVGRLEVQAPLGVGGFAEVVRAHDPELASGVAIKVLAPRWAADPDARERFLAEARHLRRVRNPSVVAVFDIGELDDGRPYFVMELADRGPLDRRLADPALPPVGADAAGIARLIDGLAEGLGAIHESGLVHRDLNPRNLLLRSAAPNAAAFGDRDESGEATTVGLSRVRADERVVIADLGLAKDVAANPEVSVIGGSAGYQAPEQLLADGIVGPWSDVYATSALLYRVLTGERPPEPGRFDDVQQLVEPQWRPVLRRGLDPETSARFGSIAEFATAAFSALGFDRTTSGRVERAPGGDRLDACPYRGLASYEPEHADSFFGRETTSAAAVEGLRHERVLAVLGASGSGKSSVVRAGLLPAIAEGRLAGSESWPRILMTPGADPVGELRYQLRRVAESLELAPPVAAGGDAVTELRTRADAIGDRAGGLLICVDQFEEVFTHDHGRQRDAFVDVLAAVVASPTSRVRLVIAMRADFYAEAARSPWLARVLTDNQLLVGPMEATQLRRAVIGPAEHAGLEVDERLVEAVLAEMGDDPGSLPLLGHAMAETWRRREGRRLTLDGFREAGGVAGAIAQTAEHVFRDQLGDEQRVVARDLLLRMVTAGQGTPHTRRRLALDEIDAAADPMAAAVIDQLVDARLVTVDESSAQIAHEALILEWPRLRQWIDDSVDDLRLRANLQRAAQDWVDHDHDPTLLFRGTPLIAARDLAARSAGQLGPTERQFLDAAIAAADREADVARRQLAVVNGSVGR